MSEPIVFVSTHRIKEGVLDDLQELFREVVPRLEAGKPNTVFWQAYLNQEGTELTIFHVFPDADAMDIHFEGADERTQRAYEFIEPARFEIYGRPSNQALTMIKQQTGPGIGLVVKSQPLGGFIRMKPT